MRKDYSDEAMNILNSQLGAGHRVKPYDLRSDDELKQALLTSIAAYRDLQHYYRTLVSLEEFYDETLEYCDTAAWLDLKRAPGQADDLTGEGAVLLSDATEVFYSLTERAKLNCVKIVKIIVTAPHATQVTVFGYEYKIMPQDMDARIDELFYALDDAEYHHPMPDNLETFLKVMKEQWAPYA